MISKKEDHRWYTCIKEAHAANQWNCWEITELYFLRKESKLISVPPTIPSVLDPLYLRWKLMPAVEILQPKPLAQK